MRESLEAVLGGHKPWQVLPLRRAVGFDANQRFALGAGLAQNDDGAQRFAVNTRDQEDVPGILFLPQLADLDFGDGHWGHGHWQGTVVARTLRL